MTFDMMQLVEYTQSDVLKTQFPEFTALEIYGTSEEPLFVGTQIQDLLELSKIHYSRDFIETKDYVKAICKNKDGAQREQNMLTERGLYCMMFKSKAQIAERFKDFVTIVLKELRLNGQVTLKNALSKLQFEHDKQLKYLKVVEAQCDEMHDRLQMEEARAERFLAKYEIAANTLQALEHETEIDRSFDSILVEMLKKRYLKKIYFTQDDNEDECEPVEDDDHVWTMSLQDPKSDAHTFEVSVHTNETLKSFHAKLINRGFQYVAKNKKPHSSKVYGSITNLTNAANELLIGQIE